MLFLGYDPGGIGTHGVAAIQVSAEGIIATDPICDVLRDADEVWAWLHAHGKPVALGIDTLLAWSPYGGRCCDNALRKAYPQQARTVIAQNALYSSMTVNGALVARRAAQAGLPLFESHPKLLMKTLACNDPASTSILATYYRIKDAAALSQTVTKRNDDMADAVVAAWCAAQGWTRRWPVNLYDLPGDRLEPVAGAAIYPWPEQI